MLGMSRTPVREALIRLQAEGLVEIRPRHGIRVLPLSLEDIGQIYDIFDALEPKAAELLARRGLSLAERDDMEHAVAGMEAAAAARFADARGRNWSTADEKLGFRRSYAWPHSKDHSSAVEIRNRPSLAVRARD